MGVSGWNFSFHTSFLRRCFSPCCSGLEGKGGEGFYPWPFGAVPQMVTKWHWDLRAPAPGGRHVTGGQGGRGAGGMVTAMVARGGEGAAKARHRSQQRYTIARRRRLASQFRVLENRRCFDGLLDLITV